MWMASYYEHVYSPEDRQRNKNSINLKEQKHSKLDKKLSYR